ncbi:bifunctional riboflavin kinase/FAD synthetase [Geomonas azotofigens]|uniref:bifunctional riboflavin kinase/FAD synthetase n=1 Tax=Geomonas azotofigens TaxID=2843196 RepID=UPI001C120DBB|nr:bifunctional riboflavin kinase/FAD synthetase [Geomonas azotofigens]MBU5612577.1 bifunctional riboflavin kinase/FAD synthetase [Geomonas azotofigens]
MVIFRNVSEIKEKLRRPVVTIGNFDGVHLGHREIFRRVRELARELGGVSVVITFAPHPLKVLAAHKEVRLITTCREKEALIEGSGIDYLLEIPFDRTFAAMPATEFLQRVLVDAIGLERLVIGYDYAFGRGREGDVKLLRELGTRFGYSVEELQPISDGATVYSSTAVRRLVSAGDVAAASQLLGRHFSITGKVVHGHERGRGLGFPTANIDTDKDLIPSVGVYAVKVCLGDRLFDGACNIGPNPTFGNARLSIEVFLLDFEGDLYGREITLFFIERLRGEKRFAGLDELKQAIAADVARCREILREARPVASESGGDWDCMTAPAKDTP